MVSLVGFAYASDSMDHLHAAETPLLISVVILVEKWIHDGQQELQQMEKLKFDARGA